jgi:Ring finger domain
MGDRLMTNGAPLVSTPSLVASNDHHVGNVSTSAMMDDPYQINVTIIDRVVKFSDKNGTFYNDEEEDGSASIITQFQLNLVGYLLMSSFLLILSVILGLLVYSIVRRRHLLFLIGQDHYHRGGAGGNGDGASAASTGGTPSRSMLLRIQRRYETIEHWIITKKVQPHDDFCEKVVTNFGHHHQQHPHHPPAIVPNNNNDTNNNTNNTCSTLIGSTSAADDDDPAEQCSNNSNNNNNNNNNNDTTPDHQQHEPCVMNSCQPPLENDQDQRECPICMSALTKGQIVSWSANEKCSHVYHHQCIKEWLLRHVECCLCKNTFLPVDMKKNQAGAKEQAAALQELSCEYAAASATSYYCHRTGLIRIPRSVRCTKTELTMLEQRIFEGTVPPAKLVSMRGSREGSTSRTNDDHVVLVPIMAATSSAGYLAAAAQTGTMSASLSTTTPGDGQQVVDHEQPLEESSSASSSPAAAAVAASASANHNETVEAPSSAAVSTTSQDDEEQPHRPQSETTTTAAATAASSSSSSAARDVELGVTPGDDQNDPELLTASYHLQMEKSRFGDNRCCIFLDKSDDSDEVKETSSSGHIVEEEEVSDDRSQREA